MIRFLICTKQGESHTRNQFGESLIIIEPMNSQGVGKSFIRGALFVKGSAGMLGLHTDSRHDHTTHSSLSFQAQP